MDPRARRCVQPGMDRLRRFAGLLVLLGLAAGGAGAGVLLGEFTVTGMNPFYWHAPLPGPLVPVAAASPAPAAPLDRIADMPPPEPIAPDLLPGEAAGFDPGPPSADPDPDADAAPAPASWLPDPAPPAIVPAVPPPPVPVATAGT